ncbi:hypothetical protein JCM11251_004803 [Rhodosporidiobolus azoricus]
MSTPRPAVKRTYGSRKAGGASGGQEAVSSPSRSRRTFHTSTAPSSSPSRARFPRSSTSDADWLDAVADSSTKGESTVTSIKGKGKEREQDSTPPTTPGEEQQQDKLSAVPEGRVLRERKTPTKSTTEPKRGGEKDLRSFFSRASPRKKRRLSPPVRDDEDADESGAAPMSRSSSSSSSASSSSRLSSVSFTTTIASSASSSSSKPAKLEQLYLDPFQRAGHHTLSCPQCSLSYARTPEDLAFHAKHHKKVVSGVDWTSTDVGKGVTVVDKGVEWMGKEGGKVVMVDYPTADGATKRKLKDVLSTIDTELSSTSLTPAQLALSKIFLFVTPQRKVIAAAVVQRIQHAFEVVTSASEKKAKGEEVEPELLRFGEEQGAIFCSPTPLPTLLGVQRIWTSTSARRSGLATLLLTHVAAKYVYGSPISEKKRRTEFAFSQPTGEGQRLARRWTGTERFRVFVD